MPSVETRGVQNLASATNLTGLNATTGVTVAAWIRPMPTETALVAGDIFMQTATANVGTRDGYCLTTATGGVVLRVMGSTNSSDSSTNAQQMPLYHGIWQHVAVTFDDATDQVRFYRNGVLRIAALNTRDMTSNASCTTLLCGNTLQGFLLGNIFDVQVLPDVTVPPQDIPLLMNPKYQYHGVKGRYCGLGFRTVAVNGTLLDESGNGNNLTVNATIPAVQGAEPPLTPTFA